MGIHVLGTGSYTPAFQVTNEDMAKIVETNDEWSEPEPVSAHATSPTENPPGIWAHRLQACHRGGRH